MSARTFLCADIRSNSTTPRRVALARMFKEAGLRSPRTQLTKVKTEISVQGRHTEANWEDTVLIEMLIICCKTRDGIVYQIPMFFPP